MRVSGHTMGTPDRTVPEAIDLFGDLGLDGVEIVCQEGYKCGITLQAPRGELQAIRKRAQDRGLEIVGLVPYLKDINSSNPRTRAKAVDDCIRAVDLSAYLECPAVRIFAGHAEEGSSGKAALQRLVDALGAVGEYAQQCGVRLNIENHMETMATSAARTIEIVHAVGRSNVGVIYDQANLSLMGQEEYDSAIPLQWPHIWHVHVKDFYWKANERCAALVGAGIVPWRKIVARLTELGYNGFYSLEYEKRWFPVQLPAAEVGMKRSAEFLREAEL